MPGTDLDLINPTESSTKEVPPIHWLVEPLIMQGAKVLVAGDAGAFKTVTLMHLSAHLAAGRQWLGRFPIPRPRRVLYIDEELPKLLSERWSMLIARGAKCHDAPWLVLRRPGLRFREPEDAERLLHDLRVERDFEPDVIVVDSFTATFAGDNENDPQQWQAYWRALDQFVESGITVVVTHHKRKAPATPGATSATSEKHAVRGSGHAVAGSDEALTLSRIGESNVTVLRGARTRSTGEHGGIRLLVEHGEDAITVSYLGEAATAGANGAGAGSQLPREHRRLKAWVESRGGRVTTAEVHRYLKSVSRSERFSRLTEAVKHYRWLERDGHGAYKLAVPSPASTDSPEVSPHEWTPNGLPNAA